MPIITFKHHDENRAKLFAEKISELAKLIDCPEERIAIFHEDTKRFFPSNEDITFVSVQWIARPQKQEEVSEFITNFIKTKFGNGTVQVVYTNLNGLFYKDGKLAG